MDYHVALCIEDLVLSSRFEPENIKKEMPVTALLSVDPARYGWVLSNFFLKNNAIKYDYLDK